MDAALKEAEGQVPDRAGLGTAGANVNPVALTGKFVLYVRAGPGGLPLASLPLPFASASASWFCLFPLASLGPDLCVWAYNLFLVYD